jgi:lysophospholipase L1-like esterase
MKSWVHLLLLALVAGVVPAWAEDKWSSEVAAVEGRLARLAPAPGGVVFAGSSSIRLWKLDRSFPGMGALNAGFGGSCIADCERHAGRLIFAWKPRVVVFYAGDNDVANGLSADEVVRDFAAFASSVHAALPECRLIFLSIKPSASRWKLWPRAREANARIRALCEAVGQPRLTYVDVATPLLGADGEPDPRLYDDDRLHLNEAGYARWREVLEPVLVGVRGR